jgi:hypothetical protein
MANHLLPSLTSNYSDFVTELSLRLNDLAVGLDPTVTTAENLPLKSIKWNQDTLRWERLYAGGWDVLASTYGISISGNAGTVSNGVYTTGVYLNPDWITGLAGSKISGNITGNAATATKLATPRNINGVAFDGSDAISINLNNSVTFNNSGTGTASGSAYSGASGMTVSYNTVGAPSTSGVGATGTWSISITGNAATATSASTATSAGSVTNGVYTTGAQVIGGSKTFTESLLANGNLTINNSSPTIYFQDTDNRSAMLHCNSSTFYLLRGSATNSSTWSTFNGLWPISINLENNDFTSGGNVTAYSDLRLKENITTIDSALDKALCLRGVYYNRIGEGSRKRIGVIAQEIREILPEVVIENNNELSNSEDKILSVDYGNITALLIEAIKELKAEVDQLKAKVS